MTIDKCKNCKYLTNKPIGFGGTIIWCEKNNDVIRVSRKDYKTLISKCPKENTNNKETKFRKCEKMDRKESLEIAREIVIKAINNTPFCEEAYPNIKEDLLESVKNYNPKELND